MADGSAKRTYQIDIEKPGVRLATSPPGFLFGNMERTHYDRGMHDFVKILPSHIKAFAILAICYALIVSPASAVTIATVRIGNPGNPADTRYANSSHFKDPYGFGAVTQTFNIGKFEVTNAQYVAFLNSVAKLDPYGLYNTDMTASGGIDRSGALGNFIYAVKPAALGGAYPYDNKPVVWVTWGDALRFTNWLHNGQPIGGESASTTEDGAYSLNGATSNEALTVVQRNLRARWWLPSEDEWYKAAYHKNDGVTSHYWDYPTRTNTVPNNNPPSSDTGNSANFRIGSNYTTGNTAYPLTDVGAYTRSASPYGTFDQGGNTEEFTESFFAPINGDNAPSFRGGWCYSDSAYLAASLSDWGSTIGGNNSTSFRVASSANIVGDYNGNGVVEAADFVLWRKSNPTQQQDYTTWRANFGGTAAAGATFITSIPEPAELKLLVIGALSIFLIRPRLRVERAQVLHGCRQLVS